MVVLIENMTKNERKVVLKPADLEAIERVIYRNGDDIAMAVGRAFERLEEKIIDGENRIYGRLMDIESEMKSALTTLRLLVEGDSEVLNSE